MTSAMTAVCCAALVASASPHALVRDGSFESRSLGRAVEYTVLLPRSYDATTERFPVLYLLHGSGDDRMTWVRKTDVETYAEETSLIVVIPDAGDHWYTNSASDPTARHEDVIALDLVAHVDAAYRTIAQRCGRAIDGVSMGGYGAMKIGFKRPELFCSVGSHSGALQWALSADESLLGPVGSLDRRSNDPFWLLLQLTLRKIPPPQIVFCCAEDDHPRLLMMNRAMENFCRDRLDLPCTFRSSTGGHDYAFWDPMLARAMRDHAAAMCR